MSDLIGRFLSFEEQMGRSLVKFTYYISLFYMVVYSLFAAIVYLLAGQFGLMLLVPFKFALSLLFLRVAAEFLMAVLSIDDNLLGATTLESDGAGTGIPPSRDAYRMPVAVDDDLAPGGEADDEEAYGEDDGITGEPATTDNVDKKDTGEGPNTPTG